MADGFPLKAGMTFLKGKRDEGVRLRSSRRGSWEGKGLKPLVWTPPKNPYFLGIAL
jgi:hypothetical protein